MRSTLYCTPVMPWGFNSDAVSCVNRSAARRMATNASCSGRDCFISVLTILVITSIVKSTMSLGEGGGVRLLEDGGGDDLVEGVSSGSGVTRQLDEEDGDD